MPVDLEKIIERANLTATEQAIIVARYKDKPTPLYKLAVAHNISQTELNIKIKQLMDKMRNASIALGYREYFK
jgi:hypothetical protein